jgi:hypothetical protein
MARETASQLAERAMWNSQFCRRPTAVRYARPTPHECRKGSDLAAAGRVFVVPQFTVFQVHGFSGSEFSGYGVRACRRNDGADEAEAAVVAATTAAATARAGRVVVTEEAGTEGAGTAVVVAAVAAEAATDSDARGRIVRMKAAAAMPPIATRSIESWDPTDFPSIRTTIRPIRPRKAPKAARLTGMSRRS